MFSSTSRVLATLLVLASSPPAIAQTDPPQTPPPATPPPAVAAPAAGWASRVQYGVRFGPSFTTLTSVEAFDPTAAPAAFEPTMNFGGFATLGLTGALSFQAEVLFAAKGQRIRDKDAAPIITSSGELKLPPADRVVLVRYLEFPLLLRMAKRTHENTSLYAIGGLALGLRRNAVIREVVDSGRHEDIGDLVSATDMSYIFGAGLQHKRWLVDARVVHGMKNIAADPSQLPVKTSAFSVLMGARF